MEELIEKAAKEAGITEEQARIVLEVYVNFLKGEVSDNCAAQIEGLIKGHT